MEPGEIINVKPDAVIAHDIGGTAAFRELERRKITKVFDPNKIYMTADHFVPSPTLEAAEVLKDLGVYMRQYKIKHWFEQGQGGICHALFPDEGLIRPSMVVVGADSHTCTYGALGAFATGMGMTDIFAAMAVGETWLKIPSSMRFVFNGVLGEMVTGKDLILHVIGQIGVDGALYKAMEFTGDTICNLPIEDRFTMCNMAIEAGAKNGIIEPDRITDEYLQGRTDEFFKTFKSDADAVYESEFRWDASLIKPLVAKPNSPENVVPLSEINDVKLNQVVIGSCTDGRISDLRAAAQMLKGKKVAKGVRLLIFPATQENLFASGKGRSNGNIY